MKKISIIHPSRQRAQIATEVAKNWLNKSSSATIEYIFSLDTDDNWKEYASLFRGAKYDTDRITVKIIHGENKSAIQAINAAAERATGDLLIVVSDDFDCPQNWDVDLLNYTKNNKDFVVKTWDGLQPWIMTLPIMDRAYYERFGYIYYPGYKHMFCDTEMTHVGDLLDRTLIVPMTFPHNHYTQPGGIPRDGVSQKNDNTWAQGEATYLSRLLDNFGLRDEEIKGVLRCDMSHYNWLKSKGINVQAA